MLAIVLINATPRWVTLVTGVSDGGNVGVTVDGLRHTATLADVSLFCDTCVHAAGYVGKADGGLFCRTCAQRDRVAVQLLTPGRVRTHIGARVADPRAAATRTAGLMARLQESQRVAVARLPRKAA